MEKGEEKEELSQTLGVEKRAAAQLKGGVVSGTTSLFNLVARQEVWLNKGGGVKARPRGRGFKLLFRHQIITCPPTDAPLGCVGDTAVT